MLATERFHRMLQHEMSLRNLFTSSLATRRDIYLGTSSPRAVFNRESARATVSPRGPFQLTL